MKILKGIYVKKELLLKLKIREVNFTIPFNQLILIYFINENENTKKREINFFFYHFIFIKRTFNKI